MSFSTLPIQLGFDYDFFFFFPRSSNKQLNWIYIYLRLRSPRLLCTYLLNKLKFINSHSHKLYISSFRRQNKKKKCANERVNVDNNNVEHQSEPELNCDVNVDISHRELHSAPLDLILLFTIHVTFANIPLNAVLHTISFQFNSIQFNNDQQPKIKKKTLFEYIFSQMNRNKNSFNLPFYRGGPYPILNESIASKFIELTRLFDVPHTPGDTKANDCVPHLPLYRGNNMALMAWNDKNK